MRQVNQESLKAPQTKNMKRKPRSRAKANRKSKRRRQEKRREKKRREEQERNRGGERSEAKRRAEKRKAEKTDERRHEGGTRSKEKRRTERGRERKNKKTAALRKPQAQNTLNRSSPQPATSSATIYFARRTGAQTRLHKKPGQGSKTHTMELRWEKCVKHWKYGHQSSPAGISRGPSYPPVAPATEQAVCSKISFFSHATGNCQDQSPRRSALMKRIDVETKCSQIKVSKVWS